VLLIATWPENDCVPPPIGSVGVITVPLNSDRDYEVSFPEYPWPHGAHDPDWIVPHWAVIPIDDGNQVKQRAELLTV
jgi:hypothetical protein